MIVYFSLLEKSKRTIVSLPTIMNSKPKNLQESFPIQRHSDMYIFYMSLCDDDIIDLCHRRNISSFGKKKEIVERLMRQDRKEVFGYSRL